MDFPHKTFFSDDPLISLAISHRFPHLLHDLPPPLNLFSPPPIDDTHHHLLRALRLSQSRAREAEERAELANSRIGRLASLLLKESMLLSAHRRWMAMLEFEIEGLRRKMSQPAEDDGGEIGTAEIAWCLTLAVFWSPTIYSPPSIASPCRLQLLSADDNKEEEPHPLQSLVFPAYYSPPSLLARLLLLCPHLLLLIYLLCYFTNPLSLPLLYLSSYVTTAVSIVNFICKSVDFADR